MASVSKPITAIEVMRLVDRGQLRLDDRVFGRAGILGETYGPEQGYADPRVLNITVKQLLEHTAGGWDNNGGDGSPDPMLIHSTLGQAALIETILRTTPLEFAPGTRHQYSNFGYAVLGRVIERVTGKPYETALRDDIFAKSGADSFAVGGDTLAEKLPDEVTYHQAGNGWLQPYGMRVRRMDAHGGLIATPIDLLRVAVRADGFPTVPDLLSPSSIATMTTPTTAPDTAGNRVGYAKGWGVDSWPNWGHNGYLPGTKAELIRTTNRFGPSGSEEFVVYAATNSTNADGTPDANLAGMLWDIMSGVRAWPTQDLF
jgi:CubicO group peptidase (beta-lactamase class C family)